jgi:excisionase family DNA binding protein
MTEPLLTVADLAQLLRTTPRGIYNRVHRREIPHVKIGARVYFDPAVIRTWLTLHTVDTGDDAA